MHVLMLKGVGINLSGQTMGKVFVSIVIYSALLSQSLKCFFPTLRQIKPSSTQMHSHAGMCVKFLDNLMFSTWQTDGSSNLSDRHCLLRCDLMIAVCLRVRVSIRAWFPWLSSINPSLEGSRCHVYVCVRSCDLSTF